MLFPVNLLTSTEETKSKPGQTASKTYSKPRLTQVTKFTTTQNSHASGTKIETAPHHFSQTLNVPPRVMYREDVNNMVIILMLRGQQIWRQCDM